MQIKEFPERVKNDRDNSFLLQTGNGTTMNMKEQNLTGKVYSDDKISIAQANPGVSLFGKYYKILTARNILINPSESSSAESGKYVNSSFTLKIKSDAYISELFCSSKLDSAIEEASKMYFIAMTYDQKGDEKVQKNVINKFIKDSEPSNIKAVFDKETYELSIYVRLFSDGQPCIEDLSYNPNYLSIEMFPLTSETELVSGSYFNTLTDGVIKPTYQLLATDSARVGGYTADELLAPPKFKQLSTSMKNGIMTDSNIAVGGYREYFMQISKCGIDVTKDVILSITNVSMDTQYINNSATTNMTYNNHNSNVHISIEPCYGTTEPYFRILIYNGSSLPFVPKLIRFYALLMEVSMKEEIHLAITSPLNNYFGTTP